MSASGGHPALSAIGQQGPLREDKAGELRIRTFSVFLEWVYVHLRGPGSSFARRLLMRMLFALEGGPMRSGTVRRVMEEVHGVMVGAHSYGCFDPVRFPTGTRIDRYVSVGPGVWAFRRNHPTDRLSMHPYFYHPEHGAEAAADVETRPLKIEAGAWLGARVLILPGCRRIGQGAVVAAGAVLTRDVEDYAIVGGNPARLIRYRFNDDAMAAARATRWWRKSPSQVRKSQKMTSSWAGHGKIKGDASS